jgi:hypothetical protein
MARPWLKQSVPDEDEKRDPYQEMTDTYGDALRDSILVL